MRFLIASNNDKKLKELINILENPVIEFVSLKGAGFDVDIEETGKTFEENALLKAKTATNLSGLPSVADDSGLGVDALNGAPGIFSARYEKGSDSDRVKKLLKEMQNVPKGQRQAKFVCAVSCVFPDGREFTVRGECEGEITFDVKGAGGFGYDPVFYVPYYGMTFSEMPDSLKNKISHRAKALEKLKKKLYDELGLK